MHHDIGAVLERTDEIRRAERVVHHHGQPMGMGKRGDGIDVGDIRVGVAKGLEIDERSLRTDRRLDLGQIVDIHERGLDPKIGEGVGQQVVCAAVDGLLGNHVSPGASKRLDGEGDLLPRPTQPQAPPLHLRVRRCDPPVHPGWSWSGARRCCRRRPAQSGRRHAGNCGTRNSSFDKLGRRGRRSRGRDSPVRHAIAGCRSQTRGRGS